MNGNYIDITPYEALERMRQLTDVGVTFSFSFESLNKTQASSKGLVVVSRAILRQGLRDDQSNLSQQLVGYKDLDQDEAPRFFHIPLLMTFNEHKIKP
ncbi:hypothetical protein [Flavobacterium sp.]|uniref:hypothetical protein n=1 Tax=Flavobacterium sp. TaxID=239 RepID=UPI00260408B9|nr:hypothetical protein [Flavobacterium sp.]